MVDRGHGGVGAELARVLGGMPLRHSSLRRTSHAPWFLSDRQGRHVIDLARALTQLRAERDLIEQAIEQIASLAEARKRGPGRPKALPRAGARAAGRGSEERTLTRRISP